MAAADEHRGVGRSARRSARPRFRPQVLLISGEEVISVLLRQGLRQEGLTADLARDGTDGLHRVRRHHPAVIVVDLVLPDMDGLDFIEACRAIPSFHQTPIVLMASTDELLNARRPVHGEPGVAAVTKPFELDAMMALLMPLARRTRRSQPQ
jgi:DNA-binding response OmpR family regulator